MKNKLTTQETAKIFAMYYGCEFTYNKGGRWLGPGIVQNNGTSFYSFDNLKDTKLLLTNLSAISAEDAIEVAKMCDSLQSGYLKGVGIRYKEGQQYDFAQLYQKWFNASNNEEGETILINFGGSREYVNVCKGNSYFSTMTEVFQYLISKGYAVPLFISPNHPLNGQTAIELGIAIDKSQNK